MSQSAFNLIFTSWPPESVIVRHGVPAPVGAIRTARKHHQRYRLIKVRMDGPPSRRWMKLSRFWWIKFKGKIPEGKVVGHFDGDTMNDDPKNYALFNQGEILAIMHDENQDWSKKQHSSAAKHCGKANAARAATARLLGRFCPTRWYAVDFRNQVIQIVPYRERWQVYVAHGFNVYDQKNQSQKLGTLLGFPELSKIQAAILNVLIDHGGCDVVRIRAWAHHLLEQIGFTAPSRLGTYRSELSKLKMLGFVDSIRSKKESRIFFAARGHKRCDVCCYVAVRGSKLNQTSYRAFQRVVPASSNDFKPSSTGSFESPTSDAISQFLDQHDNEHNRGYPKDDPIFNLHRGILAS